MNVQLFMGDTAGNVGTKYICVRLVPDSRFLIRIPNPCPNTNTNQHLDQKPGIRSQLRACFPFCHFELIFKIQTILFIASILTTETHMYSCFRILDY